MTQRQQYAVVPKPLLDKLIYAVEQESMAYADPIAHVYEAVTALEEWQAAPPPPDQVLSGEEIETMARSFYADGTCDDELIRFAQVVQAAVLAKFKESAE